MNIYKYEPINKSWIDECGEYKIIDATKIQTKVPNQYKQGIKNYLSNQLKEVNLTTLFANLDNDRVPKIFENPGNNKATIEKYNRKIKLNISVINIFKFCFQSVSTTKTKSVY
jgi:hypothetical protein